MSCQMSRQCFPPQAQGTRCECTGGATSVHVHFFCFSLEIMFVTFWKVSRSSLVQKLPPITSQPACLINHESIRGKRYMVWPNDWLPFHWEKPEPVLQPGLFQTGDPEQSLLETADLEEYREGYEFLKDAKDVPESVKKQYRLKMTDRAIVAEHLNRKRVQLVQRHPHDTTSWEVKVAKYTSKIRSLVEVIKYMHPNDARSKVAIDNANHQRGKYLAKLYRQDRDRYQHVIKMFNIDYKPTPAGEIRCKPIHRKATLRVLTQDYCNEMRKNKLDKYHDELKSQQEDFLKQKEEDLNWIKEQMRKYHITEADVSTEYKSQHDPRPVPPPKPIPAVLD